MLRRSPLCKTVVITLALFASLIPALAAGPVFWEISKQEDIVKGDAQGVSIAENGTITLAPQFRFSIRHERGLLWSSAADAAGNIYLGTGTKAHIQSRAERTGALALRRGRA